jgi:hypothetical protein
MKFYELSRYAAKVMNHVEIPRTRLTLAMHVPAAFWLVPSGDPHMTVLAEICDIVNSLALTVCSCLR